MVRSAFCARKAARRASCVPQPSNGVSAMPVKPGSQTSTLLASGSSTNCACVRVSVAVVM
jgi:hypothetical protein